MVLFWAENVLIGMMNVFRMLIYSNVGIVRRIFTSSFFSLHYGPFTFGHGVFVFSLFSQAGAGSNTIDQNLAAMFETIFAADLGMPLLALGLSHFFSFFLELPRQGKYLTATLPQLMMEPYGQVVVLHFSIMLGGVLVMLTDSPVYALPILIAIKTALDFRAHRKEHSEMPTPGIDGEPTITEIVAQLCARDRRKRADALAAESSLDELESRP